MRFKTRYCNSASARIHQGYYHDGTPALIVKDGSETLLTATVCLSAYGSRPARGNCFIKDYSENEGVLRALQGAGVVGEVVRVVGAGWAEAYEVPLLGVDE